MIAKLARLGDEFLDVIQPLTDEQAIRAAQAQYLGKKGKVSELMKELSKLPPADRPTVGQAVNRVKQGIEDQVAKRLAELEDAKDAQDLARRVDITLPARPVGGGHLHLLTQVRFEAVQIFAELGFVVAEGPQIETDWHTFEALAIPKDHPARDMQDTFYVSEEIVLRTHTSPVQVRTMLTQPPPIRIVAPGHVYRRDDDPTHSPMFTQIEGLAVDEGISFADLKGTLLHFVKRFFMKDLGIRLRPSYFPFVEPGAEVDMQCSFCGGSGCRICKQTGWVEIGGAGMVDPEVFANCKIDSEKYSGFAFGMGLERMAMLRHGVNDIKFYYEGDVRFLEQF
ncbi:MAG: phenylalanine--tRNA ligase subunit alpha [Deltaproteobacteria bacterium]|nr:phenylalanine--tRNA ligase subunit alpha [Deltaproteobacteria bacterium]